MLDSLEAVADHLGANEPTEQSMSRRIYKDTSCGAWLEVAHNEDGTLWGIRIGTIVEGTDACPESIELGFPFEASALDEAIRDLEAEAERIWNETHPDGLP